MHMMIAYSISLNKTKYNIEHDDPKRSNAPVDNEVKQGNFTLALILCMLCKYT